MATIQEAEEFKAALAAYLQGEKRIAWTEIPLGSVMNNPSVPRADVLTLERSYAHPNPRIYEVKLTRSDFLGEMNSGKHEKYFPFCVQFYFACPSGLIGVEEVPDPAGLIIRGPKGGWKSMKPAKRLPHPEMESEMLFALILRGYEDRLHDWSAQDRSALARLEEAQKSQADREFKLESDTAEAKRLVEKAEEIKVAVAKFADKTRPRPIHTFQDAYYYLVNEVETLLRTRLHAGVIVKLTDIMNRLFQGSVFWSTGIADNLRRLADQVEKDRSLKHLHDGRR